MGTLHDMRCFVKIDYEISLGRIMERVDLVQQFAVRLRHTLILAGYGSARSASGVNLQRLAELTGHSVQICRKYLLGQVIPDPAKLSVLAAKLNVSPGWLLFGDCHGMEHMEENKVTISEPLLHYIFTHANELYQSKHSAEELPDFLLELTKDVSYINADEMKSKKIIDLALLSAKHFS